jgi:hypothetical protein
MADTQIKPIKIAAVITEYKVVLNVGADQGLKRNMDFIIYRPGPEVKDPDTGVSLGILEEVIGRGVVTHVQDQLATLESSEVREGGKKIIRKASPNNLSSLARMFGTETEEIVEQPRETRPFRHAKVGDLAKRANG